MGGGGHPQRLPPSCLRRMRGQGARLRTSRVGGGRGRDGGGDKPRLDPSRQFWESMIFTREKLSIKGRTKKGVERNCPPSLLNSARLFHPSINFFLVFYTDYHQTICRLHMFFF